MDKPIENARLEAWENMLLAGMNLRYHRALTSWTVRFETALKIITATAASAAVVASPIWKLSVGGTIWPIFGLVAAAASVASLVLPFRKWEKQNGDLEHAWVDARTNWEEIYRQVSAAKSLGQPTISDDTFRRAYELSKAAEKLQTGDKINFLFRRAYQDECTYRGVVPIQKKDILKPTRPAALTN